VAITSQQADSLGLSLTGKIAAAQGGDLFLVTGNGLARYNPKQNRIEDILNDPCQDIRDIALTPDGVLLVLRPRRLDAWVAGYLVGLYELPADARAVSTGDRYPYVLLYPRQGGQVVRIALLGPDKGRMETVLWTEDRPSVICAVKGGCLVASGGNVFKVTEPVGPDRSATAVLLVAIPEGITSMAVDQDRLILYLATANVTFAWSKGQVMPVLPFGGDLGLYGETLSICGHGQVIQLEQASQYVKRTWRSLR
jgi:hypothetical protein